MSGVLKEKEEEEFVNPGSEEAARKGCLCPVYDNCFGAGLAMNGQKYGWVIHGDCPLHGRIVDEQKG